MKTLTATELKTRTGDFFDALLADGEVLLTRNGREYPVRLATQTPVPVRKMNILEALYDPATCDRDFELPPRSAISKTIDLGNRDD